MTGRGIDQVLPHPLNPRLYEPYLSDARAYVDLAENANGPVPRPVDFDYIWGEALPNNHVLDWGYEGLSETLRTLNAAGVKHAGAGNAAEDAAAPAVLNVPGKCRVLLFSFGSTTSGIPRQWRATSGFPGVHLLDDLSEATASQIAKGMRQFQRPGDLLIASIHWGGNWGYDIPLE